MCKSKSLRQGYAETRGMPTGTRRGSSYLSPLRAHQVAVIFFATVYLELT
jgi:hypothetical protein